MNKSSAPKVRATTAFLAAFMQATFFSAQGPQADLDVHFPEKDTLTDIEKKSRITHQGRDLDRPYSAFYVIESESNEPLITKNQHAVIHIASLTKSITAMAFYYCRARAINEAVSLEDVAAIGEKFDAELPYLEQALVHSDNKYANRIGLFLENLDLDFINCAVEGQDLKRGHYRIFSQVIVPEVLKPLGLKDTKIFNPTGLPPYDYGARYKSGYFVYSRKERPFNYKGAGSRSYKDPDDYNTSTPAETAAVLRYIVSHYPEIYEMMNIPKLWNGHKRREKENTNTLLEHAVHKKAMPTLGVDAGKTGTSLGAGSLHEITSLRRVYNDSARIFMVNAGYWHWSRDARGYLYKNPDRKKRDRSSRKLIDSAYTLLTRAQDLKKASSIEPRGIVQDTLIVSPLSLRITNISNDYNARGGDPVRGATFLEKKHGHDTASIYRQYARRPRDIEIVRE